MNAWKNFEKSVWKNFGRNVLIVAVMVMSYLSQGLNLYLMWKYLLHLEMSVVLV